MPQMSPLVWTFLMIFFIFFYLALSVGVYYEFSAELSALGGVRFKKFAVKLG